MTFLWPNALLLLLLVPLAVWRYRVWQRRRAQRLANYAALGMAAAPGGRRRLVPMLFFLSGLTLLLLALARPQATVSLPRVEGTVILAFDVSGSMNATDLLPTRMEAAKTVARAFVSQQPSTVKIGVVAFSDGGLAVQAPTNDQAAVLAAIGRIAPQRGTAVGQGILAALNALSVAAGDTPVPRRYSTLPQVTPEPSRLAPGSAAIVLLTDGENNATPDPRTVAQTAAERGVRIYPVGIGSAAGTTLKVNGFTVFTQLDEAALQQVAQISNGSYFNVQDQDGLRAVYQGLAEQLVVKPERLELTALLAGFGGLLLLVGGLCSLWWFGRLP